MKVPALLKNKYVCYALMALAALNVIGYVTVKAWECLALFLLTCRIQCSLLLQKCKLLQFLQDFLLLTLFLDVVVLRKDLKMQ